VAFSLSNTTSDLTLGGIFTRAVEKSAATAAALNIAALNTGAAIAASGGTATFWFVTPSGYPGTLGATGTHSLKLNVSSGSTNAGSVACTIYRVNSAGTIQTTGTTQTVSSLTSAVKPFTFTNENLGTFASTDRTAFKFVVTNTATMSITAWSITPGTDGNNTVQFSWDPNLIVAPEQIDAAIWTRTNAAVTANAVTAPDGTTTADKITESVTTSVQHVFKQSITRGSGTNWTQFAFVRAGERGRVVLETDDSTVTVGGAFAGFDCVNGAVVSASGNVGVWGTGFALIGAGAYMTPLTIGGVTWYLCELRFTNSTVTTLLPAWYLDNQTGSTATAVTTYAGTVGNGEYFWGVGLEPNASASAYPGVSFAQAYSFTAASGSYALTGVAAVLKAGRKVGAASGTYTITGTSAVLRRGYPLVAAPGSYTLTGTSAVLREARRVAAASGSYTIAGVAAVLARGLKVGALSGSYALTGTAATLRRGFGVTAAPGSYVLTGVAAGLRRTAALVASSGSYTISGTAAGLKEARRLIGAAGSYAP
jgi:hypothetical protein